jgi:MFS family permease
MTIRLLIRSQHISRASYAVIQNTRMSTAARQPFRWSAATPAQRRVVIAAALGWMLDAFDVMLYSIVLASLISAFSMSKSTAGLLNALTLIASAFGGILFGLLADRFGRRSMLSASILIYSIFTAACGFTTTIPALAACRFLLGLGMGGEWNTGAALVAETWPAALRGRALGIVQSSWAVGYALSALVAGLILSRLSWRYAFFAGILPAIAVLWIRREVPEPEVFIHARSSPASRSSLRPLLKSLILLTAANTCGMFAWWGLFTWIPAYLMLDAAHGGRGFSLLNLTGFLVALNLLGMLPGYLLFGVIADRFGRRLSFVGYLVAAAASVALFAAARQPVAIFLAACVSAFFGTGFFTGSGIIGSEIFPTSVRATALGISYNLARGLSALAPFTVGALAERYGLAGAFSVSAAAFALAAVFGLLLPETSGASLDAAALTQAEGA